MGAFNRKDQEAKVIQNCLSRKPVIISSKYVDSIPQIIVDLIWEFTKPSRICDGKCNGHVHIHEENIHEDRYPRVQNINKHRIYRNKLDLNKIDLVICKDCYNQKWNWHRGPPHMHVVEYIQWCPKCEVHMKDFREKRGS